MTAHPIASESRAPPLVERCPRGTGEKMNKEEFEKAVAEVAERLGLFLDQPVDARIEAEREQRGGR